MKKLLLLLFLSFFSTQGFAASCPDGSDPIQTVSADGSYYVYKCGNTKNEQTSSNNEQTSSSANEDTIVVQNITPPKDNCSETKKKRVTTEEYTRRCTCHRLRARVEYTHIKACRAGN